MRGRLHLLVHCRLQSGTAGVNLSSFLWTSPSPIAIHVILLYVGMLYPRHSGGAVPLRFLVESAITVVTPRLFLKVPPYPSHMCFFFAVLLPNQGRITAVLAATLRGQSGATTGLAVLPRCYCAGAGAAGRPGYIWDVHGFRSYYRFRWCRRVSMG